MPEIGVEQLFLNQLQIILMIHSHSFLEVIKSPYLALLLISKTTAMKTVISGCNGRCFSVWVSDDHFIKTEEDKDNAKMHSQMSSPPLGAT